MRDRGREGEKRVKERKRSAGNLDSSHPVMTGLESVCSLLRSLIYSSVRSLAPSFATSRPQSPIFFLSFSVSLSLSPSAASVCGRRRDEDVSISSSARLPRAIFHGEGRHAVGISRNDLRLARNLRRMNRRKLVRDVRVTWYLIKVMDNKASNNPIADMCFCKIILDHWACSAFETLVRWCISHTRISQCLIIFSRVSHDYRRNQITGISKRTPKLR